MVRKFPTFYSEWKKRTTSGGSPQFPNGFSGKLLFHLIFNRKFRIFWLNGKHPLSSEDYEFLMSLFLTYGSGKQVSKLACPKGKLELEFLSSPAIQRLIIKLPFNLRAWRRLVDHIMETEERNVTFSDLAEFVDNEARVTDNPVFGKILEDAKPK